MIILSNEGIMGKQPQMILLLAVSLTLLLTACGQLEQLPIVRSEKTPEFEYSKREVGMATPGLRAGLLHPPLTFNPVTAFDPVSKLLASQLTATLYRFDPLEGTFEPHLATGYDRDKDNLVFIIHLRRNITFSDRSAFDADDVISTISYIQNLDVPTSLRAYLSYQGAPLVFRKVDEYTLTCTSAKPLEAIEPVLAKLPVLSSRVIDDLANQNRLPRLYALDANPAEMPSIGPYLIKSYSANDKKVVLQRNPEYWVINAAGQRLPYIEEVNFSIIGNYRDLSLKFREGETDVIDALLPADAERLKNVSGMQIFDTGPSCSTYVAWFNQNAKTNPRTKENYVQAFQLVWFRDAEFRNAVASAINHENIANTVFERKAATTAGLISPLETGWFGGLKPESFTGAAARQRLLERGYSMVQNALNGPNRAPVNFQITVLTNDDFAKSAGMQVEAGLASLGAKAVMTEISYELYYRKVYSDYEFQMAIGLFQEPVHPYFLRELFHTISLGRLWFPEQDVQIGEADREIDTRLDELYRNRDWNARYQSVHQIEQSAAGQHFLLPLVKPHGLFGAKGKVQNAQVNHRCSSILWNLEELYILAE